MSSATVVVIHIQISDSRCPDLNFNLYVGELLWRISWPCVTPYDGIAIDPVAEATAFVVCDNAGPAGLPGESVTNRLRCWSRVRV